MSGPQSLRESGHTQSEEVTAKVSDANDELVGKEDAPITESRRSRFRTTGLSRLRFDWRGEDQMAVARARETVNDRIMDNFRDAYEIMLNLFNIVREPEVDSNGEVVRDEHGWPVWRRTSTGGYVEDFTKLTRGERENFLFQINTRSFAWTQSAADAWAEAMFAKAQWEDQFAIHYDRPQSGTIDDRTAVGRLEARDERYFTVFVTYYSRRADAVVESMRRLEQRLRDSMEF